MMIDLELADKPEVHQIAAILTLDCDAVVGKLIRVWSWFDKQTVDGNAPSVTISLIDRLAAHNGFASAMSASGWLSTGGNGLRMPNFDRWNGKSAKKRALSVRRVQRWRNADVNDASVTKAQPEKRREEITTPLPPSGAFLRFWAIWPRGPRKRSQGKCWELWLKKDFDQTATAICAHIELMKQTSDWQKGFLCAPLVYLNQRQWEGADLVLEAEKVSPLYRREGVM